jgi:hypothetical protein
MPRTQSTTPLPRLSLLKTASKNIGVPYTTMRDRFFNGEFAAVRIGRRLYVADDEIARFVERHTERMAG